VLGAAIGCGPGPKLAASEPPEPVLRAFWTPQDVVLDVACTPSGLESCFDAIDNNCNGAIDEGCGVRTGIVQFSVAWADPTADVDLFVTDPKGETARVNEATELGLIKDRDCPGERDACQGQNTENVYLVTRQLPRGRFRILARLTRLGQTRPPLRVQFGARVGQRSYAAVLELQAVDDERQLTFEM
jgi:hypothetical protein